jgi:transposase
MKENKFNEYQEVAKEVTDGSSVADACEKRRVSVSGFYNWRARNKTDSMKVVIHDATTAKQKKTSKKSLQKNPKKFPVVFMTLSELTELS